jgi:hypothetical protein
MKTSFLWAALLLPSLALAALGGTLTITPLSGNAPLTANLTWNVTGGGPTTTCTASGGWAGTRAPIGTQATPVLLNDASYTLTCVTPAKPATLGEFTPVTLSWTPVTQNTDGTALTNLAGYHVLYSDDRNKLTEAATDVTPGVTFKNINNPGISILLIEHTGAATYYYTVRAVNANAGSSSNSNIGIKVVVLETQGSPATPAETLTRTVSIGINAQPKPPILTVAGLEAYKPNIGYRGQLKVDRIGQFTVLGLVCVPNQDMNGLNVVKINTPTPLITLDPGKKWPMQILARCTSI